MVPQLPLWEDKYAPLNALQEGSSLSLSSPGIQSPQLIVVWQTAAFFPTLSLFLTLFREQGFLPFWPLGFPIPQFRALNLASANSLLSTVQIVSVILQFSSWLFKIVEGRSNYI